MNMGVLKPDPLNTMDFDQVIRWAFIDLG